MPQRGNTDYDEIKRAARQGDGSLIQMAGAGSKTAGNALIYDAEGNAIDSGVAPGGASGAAGGDLSGTYPNPTVAKINGVTVTGTPALGKVLTATGASAADWETPSGGGGGGGAAPWLSITDPSSVSFSWRNQGGASVTSRTQSIYLHAPAASGDNIRGREIAAPSTPWSITIGFVPHVTNQNFTTAGMYVSDGTKLLLAQYGQNGGQTIQINSWNTVTSVNAVDANPGLSAQYCPFFMKIYDDGTNLKWYTSVNGLDFELIRSASRTGWLSAPNFVGIFANSNNATYAAGMLLVSWVQGTS